MSVVGITVDGEIQGSEEHGETPATAAVGDARVVHKNAFRAGLLCIGASAILMFKASAEEESHEHPWNAYAPMSLLIFEMRMGLLLLPMLHPQQPRIVGVAKTLVWVAFVLVQAVIGLKISAHVAY